MITFGELAFSLTVAVGCAEGFSCLAVRLMTNPVINIIIIPSAILMEMGLIYCNLQNFAKNPTDTRGLQESGRGKSANIDL
jgi:hypothetical protein